MVTPTQFIYRAAQQTPKVIAPSGKEIIYEFPYVSEVENRQHCWLCGGMLNDRGIHKSLVIKDTFTDHSWAHVRGADYVCAGCVWCLSYKTLRNYSILATHDGLKHPSRNEIAEILLNPPEPPWLLCIAVSGQKWLHFKGKINYGNDRYTVNFEETQVIVEPKTYDRIFEVTERLYNGGFTKDEIENFNFPAHKIQKYGLVNLENDMNQLQSYKGSRMLKLAVYLARKRDEDAKTSPELLQV